MLRQRFRQSFWQIIPICLLFSGCASTPLDNARNAFLSGQPEAAIAALDNPDNLSTRNALLFQMEKGLILHNLNQYQRSATAFRKASQLMDSQDYISISEQAKTLVGNEWLARYQGEYSEHLWVHTYQMMNYLLLSQPEEAAVEARQALKVLDKHPASLKQDWFTRALICLSFEHVGQINDAYIEYKKLAELMPDDSAVAAQLYGYARRLGFTKDMEKYKASVPEYLQHIDPSRDRELVLFVASGTIPRKTSGDIFIAPDIRFSFPHYIPSFSSPPSVQVQTASGQALPFVSISTNLGNVAATALAARGKSIVAKEIGRIAVKQSLVHNLKNQDETAAQLLNLLFFALEEADTRSWGTLPESLVMLRIPLTPDIDHLFVSQHDLQPSAKNRREIEHLSLSPGQHVFRKIRF